MWCNGLDATISSIIEADPSIGYKALAIKLADMGMHVTLDTMKHYMNGIIFLVDVKQLDCSIWHILDIYWRGIIKKVCCCLKLSSSELGAHDAIISLLLTQIRPFAIRQ